MWDDDVKAIRAEFNALAPQLLDSNDTMEEMEAVISEFLEKKKGVVTKVKQVCCLFCQWDLYPSFRHYLP